MKTIHKALFLIILLYSFLNGQSAVAPSVGDGSSGNPYQIATWQNLYWISQNSAQWNKYYIQTADINFGDADPAINTWASGAGWTPIQLYGGGSYDGQNYTISNLYINRPSTENIGFFAYVNGSGEIVKNLRLIDISITGGNSVGGLVGYKDFGIINNTYVTGSVNGLSNVGGLVGRNAYNEINNSFSAGTVSGNSYVGGLVGNNDGSTISNCYSTASVSGSQWYIGGLVGYNNSGTINNSYSIGSVNGSSDVGGLVGVSSNSTVGNSFWDTQTSGQSSSSGGTGKTTAEMKTQSTFTGWNFTTIWGINSSINNGYPYLQSLTTITTTPTQQTSNITFSSITNTQMTINWTNGDGQKRVVFMKQTSTGSASPVDNTTYTANTSFMSGSQIGSTGWYCVYNGTGSSVTVSNLTETTDYRLQIFEYNGNSGAEKYLTSTSTLNPNNQQTASTPSKNVYTYTGSEQNLTIPAGVNQITVKVWGAGGGGRTGSYSSYSGGSGGYSEAILNVNPGSNLVIVVGGGGGYGATDGGLGGWPGGGYGTMGDASMGGGGGVCGVFLNSDAHANALIIAGSGGGGGYTPGGAGGGESGLRTTGGYGGTQTAGGTGTNGADGSALQGGNGSASGFRTSGSSDGGGGGAGYYGGEGGYDDANGGGGGSGYVNSAYRVTSTLTAGNNGNTSDVNPPNNSDGDYIAGVGVGRRGAFSGGNGLVVISWENPLPVELTSFTAKVVSKNVTLNWQTATEQNNYGFEVERAVVSGQLSAWETIGFVDGNGNSNSPKEYSFTDNSPLFGTIVYRLKQIDNDGSFSYSAEVEVEIENIPTDYVLFQNYPNPFNPTTTIKFGLPKDSKVVLEVYNIIGEKVTTLINQEMNSGYHNINFTGNELSSGIYIYKITVNEFTSTKKFVLMK